MAAPDKLMVGQVIFEDDQFVVVKVPKSTSHVFDLELVPPGMEQAKFLTLQFVHQIGRKSLAWRPWLGY